MKIINKTTFVIKEIAEHQLTTYSKNDFAICNVIFEKLEVGGVETEITTHPSHIKSLLFGEKSGVFDTVTMLVEHTEEAKILIDANIEDQKTIAEHKASFFGHKYKVTCDYVLLKTNYNEIYQLALEENNPRKIIYENDSPVSIVSYWNSIKPTLKAIIEADNTTFNLEEYEE